MATLYFNAAVNTNWDTNGNWWTDAAATEPGNKPTSADSAVILASVASNSGGNPTIINLTVATNGVTVAGVTMTVTGVAAFSGTAYNGATITGNCTFSGDAYNNSGIITGNCTFSGTSYNAGTITGNAIFTGTSYIAAGGTVTGTIRMSTLSAARSIQIGFLADSPVSTTVTCPNNGNKVRKLI